MSTQWLRKKGSLSDGPWESIVSDAIDGWAHTGLRVAVLAEGETVEVDAGAVERILIPLRGSFDVRYSELAREGNDAAAGSSPAEGIVALRGRTSVFAGPSDVLYLGVDTSAVITGAGRIAIAEAPASVRYPVQHVAAASVPVELRGGGQASRQVQNFGVPGVIDAEKLIVCEVITPAGNWSSYPPHKHDEHIDDVESELEEIYYFEAAATRADVDGDPFGLFSTYTSPAGEIEIDARVHSGDIALVPFGYHGPAVAAPGYDLYYLNVMAGPHPERAWNIRDDPHHAWVRDGWSDEGMDARLPLGQESEEQQ